MKKADCPCQNMYCDRHGYCDDCIAFNSAIGKIPFCERADMTVVLHRDQ